MGKFNKNIHFQGCRLTSKICGDTSDMYQFVVFNPCAEKNDEMEFSDILPCANGLELEIEKDGWYRVVTFKKANTILEDGAIRAGDHLYTSEDIHDYIKREENIVLNPEYIGEYEWDDLFSICKLKKCLAELELKAFQEMLKNCGKIQCKDDNGVKSQRDFLFIAVWLIEHFSELGKIDEAQAIYNRLKGCGDICKSLINNKKGCGCNG